MVRRCYVCHGRLGRNDLVESFPVGRRLAFDAWKGRLWVVCAVCRSWNLAPIEERWEAVEEAERLFEAAAVGAATEHVTLARHPEGTELIRIGRARPPELRGWRYGRRLVERWRRSRWLGWTAAAGVTGVGIGTGVAYPIAAAGAIAAWAGVVGVRDLRPVHRAADGATLREGDASRARLVPDPATDAGWSLVIPRRGARMSLAGDDAVRALRKLVPRVNLHGGADDQVARASAELDRLGSPRRLLRLAAEELGYGWNVDPEHNPFAIGAWGRARPHRLITGHPEIRLAVEMAVNEETERRALEGEVALLEREWREAEELAAIADDLLLPEPVRAWLRERAPRSGFSGR